MTGSDWREYELVYNGSSDSSRFEIVDVGFGFLISICRVVIGDFWVFTAILKILFLSALIRFFKCFVSNCYYAVAFALSDSLLFMIIDCPLRFMVATTFILYGLVLILKGHRISGSCCAMVSILIHFSSAVLLLIMASVPLCKLVAKTNRVLLFCCFVATLVISTKTGLFDLITYKMLPVFNMDSLDEYASLYDTKAIFTVGTIRIALLFALVLYGRDIIVNTKYGLQVYFFCCIYFILHPILASIPTAFRLNVLNGFFVDIALTILVVNVEKDRLLSLMKPALIVLCAFLVFRTASASPVLTPYSNSISYIVSGNHLPYSYRDSYNYIHHKY